MEQTDQNEVNYSAFCKEFSSRTKVMSLGMSEDVISVPLYKISKKKLKFEEEEADEALEVTTLIVPDEPIKIQQRLKIDYPIQYIFDNSIKFNEFLFSIKQEVIIKILFYIFAILN